MKLWEALDPHSQAILCTPKGADEFIASFPRSHQRAVAEAAPKALDSEVADDISPEDALSTFAALVGADLSERGLPLVVSREAGRKPVLPS
jgi:hypothetical protein